MPSLFSMCNAALPHTFQATCRTAAFRAPEAHATFALKSESPSGSRIPEGTLQLQEVVMPKEPGIRISMAVSEKIALSLLGLLLLILTHYLKE